MNRIGVQCNPIYTLFFIIQINNWIAIKKKIILTDFLITPMFY